MQGKATSREVLHFQAFQALVGGQAGTRGTRQAGRQTEGMYACDTCSPVTIDRVTDDAYSWSSLRYVWVWVGVVGAMQVDEDFAGAALRWEAVLDEAPRDLLAVRSAHDAYIILGDVRNLRDSTG